MQRVEDSSRDGREVEAVEVDAIGLVGPYEGSTSEEEGIMPSSSDVVSALFLLINCAYILRSRHSNLFCIAVTVIL